MKILFCVRHNFYTSPGGAQIQILKTKEYLEEQGITCDITISPNDIDFSQYDIVHLTDLTWVYDLLSYLTALKLHNYQGKKVLSTIYWPFDDYAKNGAPFLQKIIFKFFGINGFEFFKALIKFILQKEPIYLLGLKHSYINNQKKIIANVNWMLPNSELELAALNKRLNLNTTNYSIANNAIDTKIFDKIKSNSKINKNPNLITFVARIDPRKNQLNFLKALYNTSYTIRFIGNYGPNSKSYFKKLKNLADKRGNVEFISHIPQTEVFKHMLESKVNVLTSWIETPGLVSLEAAYAECNIVVSDKGSVRDYFHEYAYYCNPIDLDSILRQTTLAMANEVNPKFIQLIKNEYSWENTAKQTINAYKKVLSE